MFNNNIRNIGISAHIDAGKTTTTERMLFYSGLKHKIGEVHDGTTTMDWMPQEQQRGITITAASITIFWLLNKIKFQINIIDTPGHIDFTMEVERSMRVIDGACMLYCSVSGIQAQSELVWKQSNKYNVSKIIFVNKMDRAGANFLKIYNDLKIKLNANPLVIAIPYFYNDQFIGVIDLISFKLIIWKDLDKGIFYSFVDIPKNYKSISLTWRNKILDFIVSENEVLLDKFLQEKLCMSDIYETIRSKTITNETQPMLCGSSFKNKGVQFLLDCIVRFLPSPFDTETIKYFSNDKVSFISLKDTNFVALAFKLVYDSFVGSLIFFRIYSGKISPGEIVFNSNNNKKEKISRILRIYASDKEDLSFANAGDIVAMTGLKNTKTGDTICNFVNGVILEKIEFPEPVISQRLIIKNKINEDKIIFILNKITLEDPSFKYYIEETTKNIMICGMGELHLEIIIEKIKKENDLEISSGEPEVAYRETISKETYGVEGKYIKQSGGRGQYGHVVIDVNPNKRGAGFLFLNKIKGGAIPKEYIPCIEKSFEESSKAGVCFGYPTTDIIVLLVEGSYHEVDSSEIAFKMAATIAFKEAVRISNPIILEPIMNLIVETPEENLGDVLSNISSKRGELLKINDSNNNYKTVYCRTPLAELFNYSTNLRSITKGRGTYSINFSCYSQVSSNILNQILKINAK